ncbi:MAG: phosphoribosylglycinamide formyltransferase [Bacilli bacterium]|nr:phosphoribosylglycinamide formyltransferase [Bacilli bacterium]
MKKELKRYAVLASGNGTTLQAIIDAIKKKKLDAEIKIVISNTSEAYALTRAKEAGIKTYVLKDYKDDQELYQVLKEADIDLVILAGYLKLIPVNVIKDFTIINTHPALLPSKYGGKGMYGMNVHRAIVENHEKETGVTLHFVNEEYDKGKIIAQTKVRVYKTDTPEDVSRKVQKKEKIQLINSLIDFSNGNIDV